MKVLLTDEEIEGAKSEAERLSWTFKVHPRFEKEKYLLGIQLKKVASELDIGFIINMLKQSKGMIWQKRGRDTCSKQIDKLEALLKEMGDA